MFQLSFVYYLSPMGSHLVEIYWLLHSTHTFARMDGQPCGHFVIVANILNTWVFHAHKETDVAEKLDEFSGIVSSFLIGVSFKKSNDSFCYMKYGIQISLKTSEMSNLQPPIGHPFIDLSVGNALSKSVKDISIPPTSSCPRQYCNVTHGQHLGELGYIQ